MKVVKVGDSDEDEKILFTATSTSEQWQQQGDFFKKKGLWEPAMKCYVKAGATVLEKEAEAYMFAQQAKQSRTSKEKERQYIRAAECFLLCDKDEHNVKLLQNAAKCLRNAKEYCSAASLFERLKMLDEAVACLRRSQRPAEAAKLYEKLGKV